MLHKSEIDIDAIDIVIGELRTEFSSTKKKMLMDVMELSEKIDNFTNAERLEASIINIGNTQTLPSPVSVVKSKNKS